MKDEPHIWEKVFGIVGVGIVVVLCVFVLSQPLRLFFEVQATHGNAGMIALGGLVLTIPAFVIFAIWRSDGLQRAGWLLAPFTALGLFLVVSGWARHDFRTDYVNNALAAYCAYGSNSRAQQEGCLDHVTYADLDRRTKAAHFANHTPMSTCGVTAGPYCQEAENAINAAAGLPDP
jgi:hypothetical protein